MATRDLPPSSLTLDHVARYSGLIDSASSGERTTSAMLIVGGHN